MNKTNQEAEFIKEHQNDFILSRVKDILDEAKNLETIKDDVNQIYFDRTLNEFEQKRLVVSITTLKEYLQATEDTLKTLGWTS